jgi:hypothetical protein
MKTAVKPATAEAFAALRKDGGNTVMTDGERYFIRLRGRVQGPFDKNRMQQMVRRGQLSRLHEVSVDGGVQWMPASTVENLFLEHDRVGRVHKIAVDQQDAASQVHEVETPRIAQTGQWYCLRNNVQHGPLDMATLRNMLERGELQAADMVWRTGMPDWQRASDVAELQYHQAAPLPRMDDQSSPGGQRPGSTIKLDASIARALSGSRPWMLFIAITTIVTASFQMLGGVWWLVLGGKLNDSGIATFAVTMIGSAAVYILGGVLLISFCGKIAAFSYQRTTRMLVNALESMRTFWTYAGIVLLVGIALTVLVLILVTAAVVSIPLELRETI